MMKFGKIILLAALGGVAAGVVSCSREVAEQGSEELPGGERVVNFRAIPAGTKVQFGEVSDGKRPTLWSDNDSELMLSLNYGSALTAGVTPASDYKTATFSAEVSFSGVSGPYTFYAVSPSSSAKALSPSREAWKVSIPCEQTPIATSPDEDAIIIASASEAFASVPTGNVDLYFYHLTSYARVSLANFTLGQDEELEAVEFTFTTPVVGDWYWKCTEGENGHELIDYGTSSTVRVNTSSPTDIWFGCAPVDVSGELLTVQAYTSAGVYEILREFPENRKFEAGHVAVFSVDMTDAEFTAAGSGSGSGSGSFELVSDASTLHAGDEVLIVYTSGAYALGAISSNGNYRQRTPVSIVNRAISDPAAATVLTLASGSTSGTWAFMDGSNYLCSASSGNYLKNSTSLNANSSWTISIVGGLASIKAQAGSSTYLRYNGNSTGLRFSCYSNETGNGMYTPSIYRRSGSSGGGSSETDPILDESVYGCWLGTEYEWEYNPGVNQMTRAYDANGVLTFTLINPDDIEELEISGYNKSKVKGDKVSLTVSWRRGRTTVLTGSYSMTLVKEDGPKVWLSDGNGKGVILKK